MDFDDASDPENDVYPTGEIVKSGVRCFPVAENPKDGSSLAQPRRQKRLLRRLCRRKARRMAGVKNLFVANGLIGKDALFNEKSNIYKARDNVDVWDLRVKALTEKLTTIEFIRVLTHLAKHRGFKSYRIAAEKRTPKAEKCLPLSNRTGLCWKTAKPLHKSSLKRAVKKETEKTKREIRLMPIRFPATKSNEKHG